MRLNERTPWLALLALSVSIIAVVAYGWDSIEKHLPASIGGSKRQLETAAPVATAPLPRATETPQIEQPPLETAPIEPGLGLWPPPGVLPEDPPPKPRTARNRTAFGSVRAGAATISERLDPQVVQKVVRQSYGRVLECYEQGLALDPGLRGEIGMRFVIARDGRVSNVTSGITFPDHTVASCIQELFYSLTFPKPEGGIVTVVYPLILAPKQ